MRSSSLLSYLSILQYTILPVKKEAKKHKENPHRLMRVFDVSLLKTELLVELGNAAAGIDQLLLAREEGVTL